MREHTWKAEDTRSETSSLIAFKHVGIGKFELVKHLQGYKYGS